MKTIGYEIVRLREETWLNVRDVVRNYLFEIILEVYVKSVMTKDLEKKKENK